MCTVPSPAPSVIVIEAIASLQAFGHDLSRGTAARLLPWWRHYPSLTPAEREQVLAAFPQRQVTR